jgi:glycosyltransferase involved in cell wall biosynthesis
VTSARAPVTVVILTFNEERNLPSCLASVAEWAADVVVVDSGSTDQTLAIAAAHGARVVTHAFDTHAHQWAWTFAEVRLTTDWVLALDADQAVTPELRQAISAAVGEAGSTIAGYFINRRQVFRGRWIRHGGYYPKYLLKLWRRSAVRIDVGDLVDHHFGVAGTTARLTGDLIEDNRNEAAIFDWIAKHNRYARLQATEELARLADGRARGDWRGNPDERTLRRKALWARMPGYVRPLGYFLYRYVLRLGFLDGKQGFVFHFLQAWWYRLLVDINLDELRKAR